MTDLTDGSRSVTVGWAQPNDLKTDDENVGGNHQADGPAIGRDKIYGRDHQRQEVRRLAQAFLFVDLTGADFSSARGVHSGCR